jgi:hypothetical protein
MRLRDRPDGASNRLHGHQWRDEERAGLQHDLSTDGATVTSIRIASARGDLGVAAHERELAEHSESQRAMVHTIAELKRGHHDTIEIPICTMSELMESQRCP